MKNDSPNGTTCIPGSGSIAFLGSAWAITGNKQVTIDDRLQTHTDGVCGLLLWAGKMYSDGRLGWLIYDDPLSGKWFRADVQVDPRQIAAAVPESINVLVHVGETVYAGAVPKQ